MKLKERERERERERKKNDSLNKVKFFKPNYNYPFNLLGFSTSNQSSRTKILECFVC